MTSEVESTVHDTTDRRERCLANVTQIIVTLSYTQHNKQEVKQLTKGGLFRELRTAICIKEVTETNTRDTVT